MVVAVGVSVGEVRSPPEKEHNKAVLEVQGEMRMFKYPLVERDKVRGKEEREEKEIERLRLGD